MDFIINFLLTWFFGLLAPVLIRYGFVQHALSNKAATWVALINSTSLWLITTFMTIISGIKDPSYGVVWFLVYLVAKAILKANGSYGDLSTEETTDFIMHDEHEDDDNDNLDEFTNSSTPVTQQTEDSCPLCGKTVEASSILDQKSNSQKTEDVLYIDGGVYTGEVIDGIPNGYGKQTWKSGDMYQGAFKNNEFHGWGTYTWHDGERYEGEWKHSKRHGRGVMLYLNGSKHEGQWCEDKFISPLPNK